MTPEQYREVEERFNEALELSEAERALLVEKLCAQDPMVGEKVRALLAKDEQGWSFLEGEAFGVAPDSLVRQLAGASGADPATGSVSPDASSRIGESMVVQAEPRFFGSYRLLEQLGRGGMGVVYRAQHRETGQIAALKTVLGVGEGVLSSLRREIRALARLRHPDIVKILDEGIEQGLPWYAMELLEGMPLNRYHASLAATRSEPAAAAEPGGAPLATLLLSESGGQAWWTETLADWPAVGPVDTGTSDGSPAATGGAHILPQAARGRLPEVLRLIHRLCSALAYLHGEGLVHRDLKPANVLVRPDGSPVLVDFGLMSQFSASEVSREVFDIAALGAGTMLYMAPEQALGELVDARADLYALGCILYELVCGQPPFVGREPRHLLSQHLLAEPAPPSHVAEGVPGELEALILKLLAKDPRHRIGYATDVAAVLERLGADAEARPELPPARSYLYRPGFGGRQEELQVLREQLGKLQAGLGGDGSEAGSRVVLMGGESGIGKTRLTMEFARTATKSKVNVLVGECLPASQQAGAGALHPLRRPLQAIADRCRERGLAETEHLLGSRGKVLDAYVPGLDALPGQDLYAAPTQLPPAAALLRLHTALIDTFAALAESHPLLLVLDDLQWADELTLGFVGFLLHQGSRRGRNMLLLATYRTEEASESLRKLCDSRDAVKIELHRFDESTVAAMVSDMLALSPPPRVFSRHLARQSEGNAFFVAEYLRAAIQGGADGSPPLLWRDQQGVWQLAEAEKSQTNHAAHGVASPEADYERLPLPASLRELVGRRLEALSPPAVQLVQAAAVLGREVDEGLLVPMTQLEDILAIDAVGELVARQVLEEAGASRLRFVHDKIREVAYERIEAEALPALHRAAAEALDRQPEAERKRHLAALGHHREQAGEPLEARRAYLAGAHAAEADAAMGEAERLYRAYWRLVAEPDEESAITLNRFGAHVLDLQGRYEESREVTQRALEITRALGLRVIEAKCLYNLGTNHWLTGNLAEACTFLEQALEIERARNHLPLVSQTLNVIASVKSQQNAMDEAYALYHEAIAVAVESGSLSGEASAQGNLALLEQARGHWAEARALLEQSLVVLRRAGERRLEVWNMANLNNILRLQGQLTEAEAGLREVIELQQQIGDRRNGAYSVFYLASVLENQGRWSEARSLNEQALAFGREAGEPRLCALNLLALARLALTDGAVEETERFLGEAVTLSGRYQELKIQALVDMARLKRLGSAELAAAESLVQEAESLVRDSLDVERKVAFCCEQGHGILAASRTAAGRLEQAREMLRGLEVAPRTDLALRMGRLERAQVAFASGEPQRLFRGELLEDLPAGLRRRLTESSASS